MSKPIRLREVKRQTVALDDHEYLTVIFTRTVREEYREINAKRVALTEDKDDEAFDLILAEVDVMLEPVKNGQKATPKASAILRKAWEEDRITVPQLQDFLDQLGEAQTPT